MATLHTTLTRNTTNNIIVGTVVNDHGIVISYALSRNALYQAGQITILSKVATEECDSSWFGDDVGMTIAADINAGNIRLNLAVDNSIAFNITFNYNITKITL